MAKQVVIKELSEAKSLAQPLIREQHAHLVGARILYLVTNQPMKRQGRVIAGKAAKNAPLLRFLSSFKDAELPSVMGGYDFILTFSDREWYDAKPEMKAALVDHELAHCIQKVKFNKKTGEDEYTWSLAAHDVEEFYGVIERHGLHWRGDVKYLADVVARQLGLPGVAGTASADEMRAAG